MLEEINRRYQDILNPNLNKDKDIRESLNAKPGSSALEYIQNLESGSGKTSNPSLGRQPGFLQLQESQPMFQDQNRFIRIRSWR